MMNISIIVPLYNVEQYILECLNSVACQTFNKGIECIIVDDCGNDNSVNIVEDYINNYTGPICFKILHHTKNKGLSAARNTGIKAAIGEYVFFLDSDDYLFPNSLLDLYHVAKNYPLAEIIQGSTTPLFCQTRESKPEYTEDVEWIRKGFATFYICDPAWNRLVKRQFILDNDLFFVEGFIQEDTIWSFHLQKYVQKMAFCFETTYFYRYNPKGIMHGAGKEKEAKSFARLFNFILDEMIHCDKIEPFEIEFLEINALRIIKMLGFEKGKKLLATQNNDLFNKLLMSSKIVYNIGEKNKFKRKYRDFLRLFYFDSKLMKLRLLLCDKKNLLNNYEPVEFKNIR